MDSDKTKQLTAVEPPNLTEPSSWLKTTDWVNSANWDGFDFYHPALVEAKRILLHWYNRFWGMDSGGAVILAGQTGCGKTHLARCVHKAYLYGGSEWTTEPEIFDRLRGIYQAKRDPHPYIARLRRGYPLIIDDVGAANINRDSWKDETYWKIFDDLATPVLISTNLRQNELPGWLGDRAASRLLEKTVKQPGGYVDLFKVPDYRLRSE